MGRQPVLAVDVDGVVSLFGDDDPPGPPETEMRLIEGTLYCLSIAAGARLRRLGRDFDLIWASGWEARTGRLAAPLGLSELPHLSFSGSAQFGSADWKIEPLESYARGRPLAWVDDSFDRRCYDWAKARTEPTLLIRTDPRAGLLDVHVEALLGWARSLGADPGTEPS